MPGDDRRLAGRWAACLLVLLLPFGEGGATPASLFLIHTLVLLGGILLTLLPGASARPRLLPRELSAAVPVFLAVTLLAAWGSPYPYASFLRCWDLAMALAVPAPRINDIVREKRGVTADTAWRLGDWLGTGPQVWMNLQSKWDLWQARKTRKTA